MRDFRGDELAVGDTVIYIWREADGFSMLYEGELSYVDEDTALIKTKDGPRLLKYPARVMLA